MIQRDKNQEVKQNVQKIIIRAGQIKQMIKSMFEYILFTQQHYKSHCKETFNNLISFENTISKNCRYQPEKTNMILRLSRQYRQLPGRIEKYAQVNLNKIPLISKQEQLSKYQLQLKKKSQTFSSQFNNYSSSIWSYNSIYQKYLSNCNSLDQIISKFKSYSDPLKFYDKSVTSQYQEMLQTSLNNSKNQETKVTTQLQLLDSKRKFLDELIKQIRELFTHLFHSSLKSIQLLTGLMADVGKDSYNSGQNRLNGHDMQITDGNESSKHSEAYEVQFQRLNTFTSIIDEGNQIINDFNDILKDKKSKKFNQQIVADHKLFNLRCQNLKKKKQKAFLQCLSLHENLLAMLQNSIKGYKDFEKQFKQKERKIFGINGIDSFKKDFQIYFGPNSYKLLELSSYMVQIPRRAFEQINVWINDNYVIFKEVIQSKKQSISKFNKFYDEIMNQHLRQKTKFQQSDPNDTQISQIYRANIVSSLDQFKFIFSELEARQAEKDKVVTQKLTLMFKFIKKQMDMCKTQNIVDRYKQNSDTLRHFKVISEAMTVFKGDSIYNILYEEFFSLSLQKNFQSKINKKQYDQAEAILKQKQKIAKKMLKRQIGCCGLIKASPIESEVYSTHKCIIDNHEKTRPNGKLKILKEGLIFEESKWNFFAQKVHILIPKSDVQSIQSKTLSNNQSSQQITEGVSIQTQKGPIVFISKTFDELFSALQKIYGETYRKSLAIDKKGLTRNDSTQSGGQGRASMMISYNKQQKVFVQQPVCINPALSKMNLSGSMDKKLKGSNVYPSAISGLSDQAKILRQKPKSKSQLKQENTIRAMYNKLMLHYDKHQFLPQKFIFLSKSYKSDDRKDYEFHDKQTHNHFLLKELKKHSIVDSTNGLTLQISYEWKVAYPTSSSLHSFKHGEKIQVNLTMSPPLIHIIQWPHSKQQIFNRHFFYENIGQMNQKVRRYIVQNTNQDFLYENIVQKQFDQNDNSEDMFVDNIKELGVSYPEELEIKQSRVIPTSNDLKIPSSGEIIDFKASNVRSVRSYRKSSIIDTGQGLIKNGQI